MRQDGTVFTPHARASCRRRAANAALNRTYVERLVKFLLWQKGGCHGAGEGLRPRRAHAREPLFRQGRSAPSTATSWAAASSAQPIEVEGGEEAAARARDAAPARAATSTAAGSASTSAAATARRRRVVDGKVVFSDEVKWNPYFEKDPAYHLEGVNDTIRRAAAAPAAHRRDRRQRGRRLRQQRAARGLALPRHRRSPTSTATSAASSARCSSGGAACRSRW